MKSAVAALVNLLRQSPGNSSGARMRVLGVGLGISMTLLIVRRVDPAFPALLAAAGWLVLGCALAAYWAASAAGAMVALRKVGKSDALVHPPGSKVTTNELLREVDEYFVAGANIAAGDTVIDVGANVGAFSLRAAEHCGCDVTLLCFEPAPDAFRALSVNMQRNLSLRRTKHTIRQIGLSSAAQAGNDLSFFYFRRFPTNSTFDLAVKRREFEIFFEDRARRLCRKTALLRPLAWLISDLPKGRIGWWVSRHIMGLEEVKARLETLDEVLRRESIARVDLLKIDVEGPELDVLRGLGPETWTRIMQVVMETHNRDGRQAVIEALLRENGLTTIHTVLQTTVDNGLESVLLHAARPARVFA